MSDPKRSDDGAAAAGDLQAIGLRIGGVAHGFAPAGAAVAEGFHLVRARQVHGTALSWVDANVWRHVVPKGWFYNVMITGVKPS